MEYARIPRRLAGYLIDLGFCLVVMLPVFIWFIRGLFSEQSGVFLLGWAQFVLLGWMLLRLIYLSIGWSGARGTLACRLLSLSVSTQGNQNLSIPKGFLRSASYLFILIGWVPLIFTGGRLCLPDLISGSRVYRLTP
jgi:uncharacterized RDD family membrane protein YckC